MFEDRKKAGVIGAEWLREASSGCWQGPSHAGLRRQLALGFHYDHSKPLGSMSAEVTRIGPGQRCEKLPSSRPVANFPPGTVRVGARPARRQSQQLGRGDAGWPGLGDAEGSVRVSNQGVFRTREDKPCCPVGCVGRGGGAGPQGLA